METTPLTLELPGKVRLVPLAAEHSGALFEALDDQSVWAYIPWPRPRSVSELDRYIRSATDAASTGAEKAFAMIDLVSGKVAGTSRYTDISPKHRQLEVGWTMIGPAFQRSHVNTAVKLLMLGYAFEQMPFDSGQLHPPVTGCLRVQLKCDHRNLPSQRAIQAIGGQFEGRLRKHRILPDGFVRDTMYYSILDSEWPAVREGLIARLHRHAQHNER